MLAQVDAKHPFHNDLELVLRVILRGASLTQRLLAFGRRQEWSLEPLDVNQTILDLQPLLQRAVGRGVRLSYNLAPNLPLIRGDAVGLEQALLNLVNARDAMPDGGSLVISTRLKDPVPKPQAAAGPPAVWIEVQDTGSGIDPTALPHIFDPFFTTKAVGTGAGLGLAVLHGIISHLGRCGRGGVATRAGALFRLSFPALQAQTIAARRHAQSRPANPPYLTPIMVRGPLRLQRTCRAVYQARAGVGAEGCGQSPQAAQRHIETPSAGANRAAVRQIRPAASPNPNCEKPPRQAADLLRRQEEIHRSAHRYRCVCPGSSPRNLC